MGIFDFFKSKKTFKKPDYIDLKIIEGMKIVFQEEIDDFEDDEDLNYWYKIVQADANNPLVDFSKEKKGNWSLDQEILEWLWGHDEEYELKMGSDTIDNKTEYIKMRIVAFGEILRLLENSLSGFKSFRDNRGLDVLSEIDNLNFEIAFCKARLYGSLKFALRHQIDKEEITTWYKGFIDNNFLYIGLNPIISVTGDPEKIEEKVRTFIDAETKSKELLNKSNNNEPQNPADLSDFTIEEKKMLYGNLCMACIKKEGLAAGISKDEQNKISEIMEELEITDGILKDVKYGDLKLMNKKKKDRFSKYLSVIANAEPIFHKEKMDKINKICEDNELAYLLLIKDEFDKATED